MVKLSSHKKYQFEVNNKIIEIDLIIRENHSYHNLKH